MKAILKSILFVVFLILACIFFLPILMIAMQVLLWAFVAITVIGFIYCHVFDK